MRVLASEDRRPVTGIRVLLSDQLSARTLFTDDRGEARFERLHPERQGWFRVLGEELEAPTRTFETGKGDEQEFEVLARPLGTVEGRVVAEDDGAPVAGATVASRIASPDGDPSAYLTPEPGVRTTTTDAGGRFRMKGGTAGGPVHLRVTAAGFFEQETGTLFEPGETTAEPVEVRLVSSGRVRGTVRDARGGPVAQATVQVGAARAPGPHQFALTGVVWGRTPGTVTRPDGTYVLEGLPRGSLFSVTADHTTGLRGASLGGDRVLLPEGEEEVVVDLVLPDTGILEVTWKDAEGRQEPGAKVIAESLERGFVGWGNPTQPFVLPEGRYRVSVATPASGCGEAEAVVRPGLVTPVEVLLGTGPAISGEVQDAAGRAVAGCRVKAVRFASEAIRTSLHGPGGLLSIPGTTLQAVTDAQGRFRIDGLVRGTEWTLWAEGPGGGSAIAGPVTAPAEGVRLAQVEGGFVVGRVVGPGSGPPEFEVELAWRSEENLAAPFGGTTTNLPRDSGGRFRIGPVPAGKVRIEGRCGPLWIAALEVHVPSGGQSDLGDVPLVSASRIQGRVVDGGGSPLRDCGVSVKSVGLFPAGRTRTGEDGEFLLEDLTPGPITLQVWAQGHPLVVATLDLRPGPNPQTFVMRAGGTLCGTVRDSAGLPFPGLSILALRGDGLAPADRFEGISDHRGRFELLLPAGEFRVSARVRGTDRELASGNAVVATKGRTVADLTVLSVVLQGQGPR